MDARLLLSKALSNQISSTEPGGCVNFDDPRRNHCPSNPKLELSAYASLASPEAAPDRIREIALSHRLTAIRGFGSARGGTDAEERAFE